MHKCESRLIITEQLTVPTSTAIVTANTVTVLCVRSVRNVQKCESRLIITEQLTVPTSKAIFTTNILTVLFVNQF